MRIGLTCSKDKKDWRIGVTSRVEGGDEVAVWMSLPYQAVNQNDREVTASDLADELEAKLHEQGGPLVDTGHENGVPRAAVRAACMTVMCLSEAHSIVPAGLAGVTLSLWDDESGPVARRYGGPSVESAPESPPEPEEEPEEEEDEEESDHHEPDRIEDVTHPEELIAQEEEKAKKAPAPRRARATAKSQPLGLDGLEAELAEEED